MRNEARCPSGWYFLLAAIALRPLPIAAAPAHLGLDQLAGAHTCRRAGINPGLSFSAEGGARGNTLTNPPDCTPRSRAPNPAKTMRLQRLVMIMRHGIRSPLNGQIPSGMAFPGGWPQWSVAPGDLTPHGAAAMRANGRAARKWLAETGLQRANGCPKAADVVLHANSAARTIASAEAFASGFAPSCSITIHHLAPGAADPMFSAPDARPERFNMRQIVPKLPNPNEIFAPLSKPLLLLASIIRCNGRTCPTLIAKSRVAPNRSNHGLELYGPIGDGASIAEALELAYLDGQPLSAGSIPDLSALHAAMLDSIVRPRAIGEALSRDLRPHLIQDLTEATGPSFRLYLGHDDTIAPLLGLLNTHVRAPGYAQDEIPVGSALGFALYTNAGGQHLIRVFFQSQAPDALHNDPGAASPSLSFPHIPTCTGPEGMCTPSALTLLLRALLEIHG